MRKIFVLWVFGALLAASSASWAEAPLRPGKPAGVRQAVSERRSVRIYIGALAVLGAGTALVMVMTAKDSPATPTTTAP